jgi:hypothetical protein
VEPGQGLPGEDHRELVPADDAGQSDEQPVPCQAALGVIRSRLDPFLFWWSTPKALLSEADIPDELLLALSGTLQEGFL